MHTMGFGPHMSRLIFLLGQVVVSRIMFNEGITSNCYWSLATRVRYLIRKYPYQGLVVGGMGKLLTGCPANGVL